MWIGTIRLGKRVRERYRNDFSMRLFLLECVMVRTGAGRCTSYFAGVCMMGIVDTWP
jgi:hypothetical protein